MATETARHRSRTQFREADWNGESRWPGQLSNARLAHLYADAQEREDELRAEMEVLGREDGDPAWVGLGRT